MLSAELEMLGYELGSGITCVGVDVEGVGIVENELGGEVIYVAKQKHNQNRCF